MLALNSKRNKRTWGGVRLHRGHGCRKGTAHALISQPQFLLMSNFAKFKLAARGGGVLASGRDLNVSAMPTWVNRLSSQTFNVTGCPSITVEHSINVLLWAVRPAVRRLKPYTLLFGKLERYFKARLTWSYCRVRSKKATWFCSLNIVRPIHVLKCFS